MTDPLDAPPLDPSALRRLADLGGDALIERVVASFLAETPGRLAASRQAFEARDAAALAAAIHGHASAAGWLGAGALQAAARDAERAARQEDWAAIPGLLERVERMAGAAVDAARLLVRAG